MKHFTSQSMTKAGTPRKVLPAFTTNEIDMAVLHIYFDDDGLETPRHDLAGFVFVPMPKRHSIRARISELVSEGELVVDRISFPRTYRLAVDAPAVA